MARECPVCGELSEEVYKCTKCGRPFHGDHDGAPGRAQEARQ